MTWRAPVSAYLTEEAVRWALYCTSPTGLGQLTQHLEARGYEVRAGRLREILAALGLEVSTIDIPIGNASVPLYVLRGTRVG